MKLKKISAILLIFCLWWPVPAKAYDQKKALRGLKGVKVKVKYADPEISRLLMPQRDLEKDIERKLKKLGVPVLKEAKPPAMSTLFIIINTINLRPKKMVIYSITVILMEMAYLKREIGSVGDLLEVRAINWYEGKAGYTSTHSVKNMLKTADKLLQNFIYDYLAVNS